MDEKGDKFYLEAGDQNDSSPRFITCNFSPQLILNKDEHKLRYRQQRQHFVFYFVQKNMENRYKVVQQSNLQSLENTMTDLSL